MMIEENQRSLELPIRALDKPLDRPKQQPGKDLTRVGEESDFLEIRSKNATGEELRDDSDRVRSNALLYA